MIMRGAVKILLVCGLVFSLSGCYPEPMTLEISFPFESAFLYSSNAEIFLYDVEEGENACPQLLNLLVYGIGSPQTAAHESGPVPVCDLRNGGFTFDDIGAGRRAVVVIVEDANNNVLLSGCRTETTAVDSAPISIDLQTTPEYNRHLELLPELRCNNMDEKCTRGC
jgi:hypothetical protein